MMQTKQQDAIDQLQQAVLQAGVDAVCASSDDADANESQSTEKAAENGKTGGASPLNGVRTPSGRPKGVRNKLTNLRDAVLEAFDTVGGADYLVSLAKGTQSDRAAFTSLVAKVLPTQINQNVEGGIKLELSWLGGRSIGTTAAQIPEQRTQVLDLQQDSTGQYRIKDPSPAGEGADSAAAGGGAAGGDSTPGSAGGAQGA